MTDGPAHQLLPRRIGVHGVRGAGKTCFLGTLYGFRAGDGVTLDFADDATCHYLAAAWKDLSEARVPGATLLALPTSLRMDLVPVESAGEEGAATPIQLCDYAGVLVEPKEETASPAARTLAADVKEWFRSCHAVLLFLDCSRPELDQVDAIDLLLTELRRPGNNGPILERPVAIVLTKWDSQGTIGTDLGKEQDRARDFLKAHHAFRQIGLKLDAARVRVFPVSSFGNYARGTLPPDLARYHPCHLHAPLVWAAEVSDLVLFEEARETATVHLNRGLHVLGLNVWPQPDHASARRVWADLRREAAPSAGPLADRIDAELAVLGSRHRQHWVAYLAAIAGLLALLVLGLNQAARAADLSAGEVLAYCERCSAPAQARERVAQADRFLGSWMSRLVPHRRSEVSALRTAAAAVLAEEAERPTVLARFVELENGKQWPEACALIEEHTESYPSSPIRAVLGHRWQSACEERDRAAALSETRRCEKESDLDGALAACMSFLRGHAASAHAAEFNARVASLKRCRADREEYETIRRFAHKGDPLALEEAARLAKAYLDGRQTERSMREEAARFWVWFDTLKRGGEFPVVVESLVIPSRSDLIPGFGTTPKTKVHVTINGRTATTEWLWGANVVPGAKLGPFRFRWGEPPGKLLVRIESRLAIRPAPAWAQVEHADPWFILARANGPVLPRCRKGEEARVVLSCPAATVPELPAYRRR